MCVCVVCDYSLSTGKPPLGHFYPVFGHSNMTNEGYSRKRRPD